MALWMEAGSEPKTEGEKADLAAIAAIKESAALEFKEKGNQYVKMGKKHYSDAIDCYTRALNQKALNNSDHSTILANRAHVKLLLGNYKHALIDAEAAIALSPTNIKAHYRATKAAFALDRLTEASFFCQAGLKQDPHNGELKLIMKQIDSRQSERRKREIEVAKSVAAAKNLVSAITNRGLRLGKAMHQELSGKRKPMLDKDNVLHWPVVFLYAEVMSSDLIEDFCETDMLSVHLDMMFSESCPPLEWDQERAYTREAVELYYETGSGVPLSKKEVLQYLLEGTTDPQTESLFVDEDAKEDSNQGIDEVRGSVKYVKASEKQTLLDVLSHPQLVIPGIPVFYVVSKKSSFYKEFKTRNWSAP
ncbi:hypothetical protein Sjap_006147 [Stephania japonica]|uniref:Cns1/TTC4 wheel domain-containing protein n=1 Tax=Stephania japonica TaxID=461633 RepID=A0AAP0PKS4_9MAGN